MSSQTVYFNNPADITKIQGQIGTTAGQVTISSANGSSTITNLESQVDQMLINRQLELFAPSFRIIPHINPDKTFWFSANDNWTITSGLQGSASSGAVSFNYDTDYTFAWTGANNAGTISTFNMILNVPSLNTTSVPYTVWSTGPDSNPGICATGTADPLTSGAMQKVTFKYKGQGQDANQPIVQASQDIAVVLPPNWLSATGGHNLIICLNGNGESNFNYITTRYLFPPYNPSYTNPPQRDNRVMGSFGTSCAYQGNFNTGANTILGSPQNPYSWIALSIPSDAFDFGINNLEESGEFMSFMYEWLATFKVGEVNKTIQKTYIHALSAGGMQSINAFDNYLWAGIRFGVYGVLVVSANLTYAPINSIENKFATNVSGGIVTKPDPKWLQNFPRTSVLFITGEFDNIFGAPALSYAGPLNVYSYGLPGSAKTLVDKFGLNPVMNATGTAFSNTGVYYGLSSITSVTGCPNQYAPYPVTNPSKYSGEDYWVVPGLNTANQITAVFTYAPVSLPLNPINVYSIFTPHVGHGNNSNWASGYGIETGYPYGWDFTPVFFDFVNKLL